MKNEIELLKQEIEFLKRDSSYVKNQVSVDVLQSEIQLKERQLERLKLKYEAESNAYLEVVYNGGMDYYDALTTGETYKVHNENETQYVVMNDLGTTSTILKSKFKVITKQNNS